MEEGLKFKPKIEACSKAVADAEKDVLEFEGLLKQAEESEQNEKDRVVRLASIGLIDGP